MRVEYKCPNFFFTHAAWYWRSQAGDSDVHSKHVSSSNTSFLHTPQRSPVSTPRQSSRAAASGLYSCSSTVLRAQLARCRLTASVTIACLRFGRPTPLEPCITDRYVSSIPVPYLFCTSSIPLPYLFFHTSSIALDLEVRVNKRDQSY